MFLEPYPDHLLTLRDASVRIFYVLGLQVEVERSRQPYPHKYATHSNKLSFYTTLIFEKPPSDLPSIPTMADSNPATAKCANCAKTKSDLNINLKMCGKCRTTHYCSATCQKADWKIHKVICGSNAISQDQSSSSTPKTPPASKVPAKGLAGTIDKPFHRLDAKTWLHDRPEQDVFKLLIDTYRLRMEDDYNMTGDADTDSIYGGAPHGRKGFGRFLRLAERKNGLLPAWWSREKATECARVGTQNGWSSLGRAVEKSDVMEHYGDSLMPMQLRMFGEQVYGDGPGGQSGAGMRQVQMMAEKRVVQTEHLDMASMFRRA